MIVLFLFTPMKKSKKLTLDSKDILLRAAQSVFAKNGYGGATVKEIARAAGLNISLVSYYFNGKEGIFQACIEQFGIDRLRDSERLLTDPVNFEDFKTKLRLWAQQFLQCHVDHEDVCTILHRENVMEYKFMREIFKETFMKTFSTMVAFLGAAKKKGILRKEMDPNAAAAMLYGALTEIGKTKEIQKAYYKNSIDNEKFRNNLVDQFLLIFLQGSSKC